MAQYTSLLILLNGLVTNVDISSNELAVNELRLGGASGTLLTQAILDNLVALQNGTDFSDGTNSHTHDGRYFTESELSSSAASSGSDLIGDDDTYANFTPAAATIKGALSGIDAALATAAGTSFNDSSFSIFDDLDNTKELAFQVAGVATGTTRTVSMPDADVNLGDIATNTSAISDNASDIADLVSLSGVAANSTTLGTFTGSTIPDSQTIKQALQALETKTEANTALINGLEWQDSALDYVVDNTVAPATEVSGDRYILSHDGGVPNAAYDGASAGDIVEFNGSVWVATTPSTGMFISADDEATLLYYWGGAAWEVKSFEATTASTGLTKVGVDIQLADAAENASGIQVSGGVITLNDLGAFDTADLAEGTSLYFTDERAQDAVGSIFTATSTVTLSYADATPAITADVNANSIDETHLTASVAGDGISGGNGTALSVAVSDIAGSGLEDDGSNNLRIAASAAGAGLIGGAGSALSVAYSPLVKKSMVAGEAMAADTSFLVRWAVNGETAGRVYKATNAAAVADGKFYAFGIALKGSAVSAGDAVDVVVIGSHTLGASDTPFGATDIGKAVYLTTAGGFSVTAPSSSGAAVWRVGMVEDTSKLWMDSKALNGIA